MERWGICMGDNHSGSVWALRKPRIVLPDPYGETIAGSLGKALHKAYMGLVKEYSSPDFLIHTGDCIEGTQRKDRSKGLWTVDLGEQAKASAPLINKWGAKAVFGVMGTKYHTEGGENYDEQTMGKVKNAVECHGRKAPPDRYIHIAGAVIHVSHKIGGTSVFQYRGTALSRELAMNRVMSEETEVYKADLIIRGHVHHFYLVQAGTNSFCVACPSWKARDDYAGTMHPFTWMPHIGVLLITIKDGNVRVDPLLIELKAQRPPLEELEDSLHGKEA